ncbi:helix-turn-helix domain-containing protein [Agrococcus sediminis]|jgi:excisionase family DNA binding protein|uniref:Helix-turn-helix domain-containing protein n=1 Tax=Agrococcus sediminis TaxID=2599924 RepID=A0A5M8Q6P7_9MICO|nr:MULTISPECIES: helix-turn-helix domain-containing protein [Agrococcus]KAA6430556.1 helix-turn-helix domain-containing protein [Agrococcus sediminis]MDR7235383.1 excisionase family DNA binding protein [Agrococcus sp. BE272]UOW01108.1 helix-turn-helix domain-containing protein [Agrococcus sp. SCSIO52902]
MPIEARRFLAVADVAEVLGTTPAAVVELLEAGELRGVRVGGAWRVADDEVQSWVDRELELERRRGLWRQAQSASIADLFGQR